MSNDENKYDPQVVPETPQAPVQPPVAPNYPATPASPWAPGAQSADPAEFSSQSERPESTQSFEAEPQTPPGAQTPLGAQTPPDAQTLPDAQTPYAGPPAPPNFPPGPPYYPGPPPGSFPAGGPAPLPPSGSHGLGTLPKVLIGAAAALVIGLGAGTVGGVVGYSLGGHGGSVISTSSGRAVTTNVANSLAEVAAKTQESVVGVRTSSGEGSGVVFTDDGYILTNNHVVASGSDSLVVTFSDNSKAPAKLVGTDAANDLAVLKVDRSEGLHPITFADSDAIKVGDSVLAIGNPLGYAGTVTFGILSAKNRTLSESGGGESPFSPNQQSGTRLSGLLQTDAAINPGNSGGALVDSAGRLIGINTAIATSGSGSAGNIGVGFAIPSNKAKGVAEQLMKDGKVAHPYLGVRVSNSATLAGAQLAGVEEGSPAEKSGLKAGDLITAINGKNVKDSDELVSMVQDFRPGDKLSLTVVRDGKTSTVDVTVGEK